MFSPVAQEEPVVQPVQVTQKHGSVGEFCLVDSDSTRQWSARERDHPDAA